MRLRLHGDQAGQFSLTGKVICPFRLLFTATSGMFDLGDWFQGAGEVSLLRRWVGRRVCSVESGCAGAASETPAVPGAAVRRLRGLGRRCLCSVPVQGTAASRRWQRSNPGSAPAPGVFSYEVSELLPR